VFSLELLPDAIVAGALVGCFYAAVNIGLPVAFGLLDVPHVAHPAFLVLGSYGAYVLGQHGWDSLLSGLALMPVFFVLRVLVYRFYRETFERGGWRDGTSHIVMSPLELMQRLSCTGPASHGCI